MNLEPDKYYVKYKSSFGQWVIFGPHDSHDEAEQWLEDWHDFGGGGEHESVELGKHIKG